MWIVLLFPDDGFSRQRDPDVRAEAGLGRSNAVMDLRERTSPPEHPVRGETCGKTDDRPRQPLKRVELEQLICCREINSYHPGAALRKSGWSGNPSIRR